MSQENADVAPQSTHVAGASFANELRQQIVDMSHWSERELEALCLGIPPAAYNHSSRPDQDREQMRGEIAGGIESGELQAERTGEGTAPYGSRWRIERVSAIRWAIGRCPKLPEWLARYSLPEIYAQQEAEKKAAGRYTLNEAAEEIARNSGERFVPLLKKMKAAVSAGVLRVYEPGRNARYTPTTVHDRYEEAYWDTLNAWLNANEPRIKWRFQEPGKATTPEMHAGSGALNQPLQRQRSQEQQILQILDELKYDRKKLPPYKRGTPGVKAKVRKKLDPPWSDDVFKKAWQRCLNSGAVARGK